MIKQYGGINGDLYKDRKPVVHTPDRITHMGIARTFQNIRLFKSQTAFENVLIGTHLRRTSNFLTATLRLNMKEEKAMREKAMNLLEIVGLADGERTGHVPALRQTAPAGDCPRPGDGSDPAAAG